MQEREPQTSWFSMEMHTVAGEERGFAKVIGATASTVLKDHKFAIKVVLHAYVVRDVLESMVGNQSAVDDLGELDVVDVVAGAHGQLEIFDVNFAFGPSNPAMSSKDHRSCVCDLLDTLART